MARRGGGIFTYVADPVTGATKFTSLTIILIFLAIVAGVLAIVLPLVLLKPHDEEGPKEPRGKVGPPMNQLPGRINIAEVAQAPSAGEAIIYFSLAEEAGTVCDTCTAEFDINLTYVGGSPTQSPAHKKVTSAATSGTARFEYGSSTGGFSPLTPGGSNATPPTQVQVEITARSVVPGTGKLGAPTTFSKTLQYVA